MVLLECVIQLYINWFCRAEGVGSCATTAV